MKEYVKKMLSDGVDPSLGRHGSALLILTGIVLLCCGKTVDAGVAFTSAVSIYTLGKVTEK